MTVTWGGWDFTVCAQAGQWSRVPGVYIFAGVSPITNQWTAFYIGQAEDFSDRIPGHEKWLAAVQLGATEVHALVEHSADARDIIEQSLIEAYQPPLNEHFR